MPTWGPTELAEVPDVSEVMPTTVAGIRPLEREQGED